MIICTQLNGFKYLHVTLTMQFNHTVKDFQVFLFNINNYILHYSFASTQLNSSKYYASLTIRLNISNLHTVKWSNSSTSNNSI